MAISGAGRLSSGETRVTFNTMQQNRRFFLLKLLVSPVALGGQLPSALAQTSASSPPTAQPASDVPDPKTFQSGDFVWPKKKGAFIPRMRPDEPPSKEQIAWEAARDRLLQQDALQSGLSPEVAKKLKTMSYQEFATLYFAGPATPAGERAEGRSVNIGGQTVYVGHVGIIEIDAQGVPHVVEAAATTGLLGAVVRSSYSDWLKSNSGMQVWHGRVRGLRSGVRKRIATEAMKQLGKPYEFFNFNLNDDKGFYCSKLVWMSVWRATSSRLVGTPIAVDDNPNPRRPFFGWFSPKQLVNAKRVALLHKPGEY